MKSTTPLPHTIWIPCTLVLVLLVGCQEKEYLEVDLERFGDSATGSGRVRYAEKSRGGCELTIELDLLQPERDYWLCLNTAFPDSPESIIIGNLRFKDEDWPNGKFYDDDPETGKKEGFWDFATIKADKNGTFRGKFFLPLPPRKDAYSVKLFVKEIHSGGNVILQAPFLRFVVNRPFTVWVLVAIGSMFLFVAITVVLRYVLQKINKHQANFKIPQKDPNIDVFDNVNLKSWEDLGIGIEIVMKNDIEIEHVYWALIPCPKSGDPVVLNKRAKKLSLHGDRWKHLLDLLAESKNGNDAYRGVVSAAFGNPQKLSVPIAELNRNLREHIKFENSKKKPPLSAANPIVVCSAFVVRYLFLDEDEKTLRFGKID